MWGPVGVQEAHRVSWVSRGAHEFALSVEALPRMKTGRWLLLVRVRLACVHGRSLSPYTVAPV